MTPSDSPRPYPGAKSVLFHIGLPKAASSFLQRRVFPAVSDASFLHLSSGPFSGSAAFLRDPAAAREAIRQAPRAKVIVSAEGLVGNAYDSFRDHTAKAAGMKEVWPQAAILLIVRRQDHFCRSLFGQALRKGFPYRPSIFLGLDGQAAPETPGVRNFDFRAADYDRLVGTYEDHFGATRVTVIPMELLIEDPAAFLERVRDIDGYQLADLPEISIENKAYSQRSYRAARLLNRLCLDETESGARFFAWLDRKASAGSAAWRVTRRVLRGSNRSLKRRVRRSVEGLGRSCRETARPLSEDQLAAIRAHFSPGNRALSARKNLQLERYGYF